MDDQGVDQDLTDDATVAQRAHERHVGAAGAVGVLPHASLAVAPRGTHDAVEESGKETPLPAPPPLRTGLESFPSSGSSLIEVPR